MIVPCLSKDNTSKSGSMALEAYSCTQLTSGLARFAMLLKRQNSLLCFVKVECYSETLNLGLFEACSCDAFGYTQLVGCEQHAPNTFSLYNYLLKVLSIL